ncbi:hypothetical protein [Falsihalocynthiibacter arcticus]|uniref:hypothetical protein n=1 Tax=Falsihalocynthiibacter arcticus TaxID=1579316 RepID=UPI0026A81CA5
MDILGWGAISARIFIQFIPVWVALVVLFAVSIRAKKRLGLYGKLFDSTAGTLGFTLVMFWVFTAIFGALDFIVTHPPLTNSRASKTKFPAHRCQTQRASIPIFSLAATTLHGTCFRA